MRWRLHSGAETHLVCYFQSLGWTPFLLHHLGTLFFSQCLQGFKYEYQCKMTAKPVPASWKMTSNYMLFLRIFKYKCKENTHFKCDSFNYFIEEICRTSCWLNVLFQMGKWSYQLMQIFLLFGIEKMNDTLGICILLLITMVTWINVQFCSTHHYKTKLMSVTGSMWRVFCFFDNSLK